MVNAVHQTDGERVHGSAQSFLEHSAGVIRSLIEGLGIQLQVDSKYVLQEKHPIYCSRISGAKGFTPFAIDVVQDQDVIPLCFCFIKSVPNILRPKSGMGDIAIRDEAGFSGSPGTIVEER